jgi:hypothetical protein
LTIRNSAGRIPQVINKIMSGPYICIQSLLPYKIILVIMSIDQRYCQFTRKVIMSIDQRYCQFTRKESIPRKVRWKDSRMT